MFSIEELRKRKGWNRSQLGRATGLDRRFLADLERGIALATPETQKVLRGHGITGLASVGQVLHKKDLRALTLHPYAIPNHSLEAWDRAASSYPRLYRKIDAESLAWLRNYVRADSVLECNLWVRLVLAGGELRLANPHSLGFRKVPVVDELGDVLGERLLPCILLKLDSLEVVFWPQVWLRPDRWSFRVDSLILRTFPNTRWGTIEVNGAGHYHEKDPFRSSQLKLDTIQVVTAEIHSAHLIENLVQRILAM